MLFSSVTSYIDLMNHVGIGIGQNMPLAGLEIQFAIQKQFNKQMKQG